MDNFSVHGHENEETELPPGFRFHPTDEELITHFLSPKTLQSNFCAKAIAEVDLNTVEPWDLPWRTKIGEKEFYFFWMRDRKYPTGSRTNRATDAGFWKATGKDIEIYRGKKIIGMKKTLVFYQGRAPKGEKTNWVMHEYRLEGEYYSSTSTARNEWVISRVFHKSSGGKKIHISNMKRTRSYENVSHHSNLQPLMGYSGYYDQRRPTTVDHANFLSRPTNDPFLYTKSSFSDPIVPGQFTPHNEMVQDQPMMRYLVRDHGNLKTEVLTEREIKTDHCLVSSGHEMGQGSDDKNFTRGPVDLDCLWNY